MEVPEVVTVADTETSDGNLDPGSLGAVPGDTGPVRTRSRA